MVAFVAVDAAVYAIDKPYSYLIPPDMDVQPGMRVIVPFGRGNRRSEGIVLEISPEVRTGLKAIERCLDPEPVLSLEFIRLAAFLRERYFCTFYDAMKAMLPAGLWFDSSETFERTDKPNELSDSMGARLLTAVEDHGGSISLSALKEQFPDDPEGLQDELQKLRKKGYLRSDLDFSRKVRDKQEQMVALAVSAEEAMAYAQKKKRSAPLQFEVLKLLCAVGSGSVKEVSYLTGANTAVLRRLEKAGLVEFFQREVFRSALPVHAEPAKPLTLNSNQQRAFDGLLAQSMTEKPGAALLYGVTGSGKTAVYIKLIRHMLDRGCGSILLVPEIALTPQLVSLLMSHFGTDVAVLHSALRVSERYDEWKRIRRGNARVVIGTRSAVFAPVKDLALLIIDEEQEHTYKSENTPRYHAREVALYRGLRAGALVVFGSATPSVETMYHAKCGDLALYTLKERFNRQAMPRVELVDLKQELRQGNAGIVSMALEERLRDTVIRGDQAILFLNRRGNSRCLVCVDCGDAPSCPRCSVYLTYHSVTSRLMCHYCGYSEPVTERCPHCGGALRPVGAGTQKVEEELRYEFPDTGILRMDADTVTAANSHEAILERFRRKEASILVGTQMVAKGLDFASVTLAGVLDADLSLYVNHYRAAETTFSLVTQLVGRSGRGADTGTAVIQTMCPEHPVLKLAAAQDYDGFYDMEIALRELRNVPPFRDLFTVTFTGLFEEHVRAAAKRFRDALAMNLRQSPYAGMEFDLLGPAPAAIAKVNYTYRYRATLSCKNTKEIRALLRFLLGAFAKDKQNKGVSAFVDVNAYD